MRVDWRVPLFVKVLCKVFFAPYIILYRTFGFLSSISIAHYLLKKLVRNFLE